MDRPIVTARAWAPRQSMLAVCAVVFLVVMVAGGSTGGPEPEHVQSSPENGAGATSTQAPGSSGPSENMIEGHILQATPEPARTFSAQSMHEVSHFRIAVVPGAPFEVHSLEPASEFCLGNQCIVTPDFDIAFFKQSSSGTASVIHRDYGPGSPAGDVPESATFAHVYLRTPGMAPDPIDGHGFVYLQGGPGSDRVPDWPPR